MNLIPREVDKLTLAQVGGLAQRRLARGLRLNHTEATALIAFVVSERIRDDDLSSAAVAQLMSFGRQLLSKCHVYPSVSHTLSNVQIEGTFQDGTKLVTIHNPICRLRGDLTNALHGSFLPIPDPETFEKYLKDYENHIIPGEYLIKPGLITLNPGRKRTALKVTNHGDRPVQVGSHYHFIETNAQLVFDRALAYGKRLDIPSGTAVRLEPGETKTISLVQIKGNEVITGGNNLASGQVELSKLPQILENIKTKGFGHITQEISIKEPEPYQMDRRRYANAYGPTTGDKVRLGDTQLILEIERDYTKYGDECVFGGGKVLREGMGQKTSVSDKEALDLVITNAIIVDYTGIYKADVGIKNHFISGIGKAGNPDVMDGVTPGMVIGATTEVLAGEGKLLVAGGVDTHVHFICPQLFVEALGTGLTTLIGGGTGPNTGSKATTCTPGKTHIQMMLQSTDHVPLNLGFTGKGNCSSPESLREQVAAGAVGLKLHEDWGTTPAAIDTCLSVCEELDVQATIHTDTLNESGFVETSINAFKGRVIHAYHTEGAGGGHAPDIITVCGEPHVIPSSTNPTRPFTVNTLDEHLDMLMVCHHLNRDIPEDIAFAESRIRGETIGAEDELHDMGAISIISSDSQAMGRIGEVITRTWQTADKMKAVLGSKYYVTDSQDHPSDNLRIKRYVSKYTINPAIAHGISDVVGSIEVGKLADLVLYQPCFFGTKPEVVLKGGIVAWAMMGDANASIPTPEPVIGRPMFGSAPGVSGLTSFAFVSQTSQARVQEDYRLRKRIHAVRGCRSISKKDMKWNDCIPKEIRVNPETYQVTVEGRPLSVPPSPQVPLARNHFIF